MQEMNSNDVNSVNLFNNYKSCECCKRPLPLDYEGNYCPTCQENLLFAEVKDFIRENDVNEYDVANYFDIPHSKVKSWIKQGRIEYKDLAKNDHKIKPLHCHKCGEPISFGTYCPKCLKANNGNIGHASVATSAYNDKMHFLDKDN